MLDVSGEKWKTIENTDLKTDRDRLLRPNERQSGERSRCDRFREGNHISPQTESPEYEARFLGTSGGKLIFFPDTKDASFIS